MRIKNRGKAGGASSVGPGSEVRGSCMLTASLQRPPATLTPLGGDTLRTEHLGALRGNEPPAPTPRARRRSTEAARRPSADRRRS
mmetsp:Transcript_21744/g.53227  ORF Transcript_21744/g.53227 Transcript_21744/m.53227 type:complete len:85 (-) Transcript_21744:67-321(-)